MRNRWDERYSRGEYGEKEPERVLTETLGGAPTGRALDLACGLGRHSIWLARRGWNVTAVDYSEVALSILRTQRGDLPIDIVKADLERGGYSPEPAAFDLVCDCCFLWRPLFGPVKGAVKPGGLVLGVFPVVSGDAGSTNPAYFIEPAELLGIFHDWEILHYFEGRPGDDQSRRPRAEIVARKPSA